MARLIVTKDHDYRFPSGSLVALKASDKAVTVKREILEYAVKHGLGREADGK